MWELGLRAIFSSTPAPPAAAGDVERTAADHSSGLGAGSSGLGAEAAAAAAAAEVAITINSNQHADAAVSSLLFKKGKEEDRPRCDARLGTYTGGLVSMTWYDAV